MALYGTVPLFEPRFFKLTFEVPKWWITRNTDSINILSIFHSHIPSGSLLHNYRTFSWIVDLPFVDMLIFSSYCIFVYQRVFTCPMIHLLVVRKTQDAAEQRPWAPSASSRGSLMFSLLPLLCWWLVGIAFGRVHEGGWCTWKRWRYHGWVHCISWGYGIIGTHRWSWNGSYRWSNSWFLQSLPHSKPAGQRQEMDSRDRFMST